MRIFLAFVFALVSAVSIESLSTRPNRPSSISDVHTSRRNLILGGAAAVFAAPSMAQAKSWALGDPNSVVGREIRSFNSLIYEFKNTALDGGLDGSKLNEPSIPFTEFGEKMKKGEVTFVEFMAPNGNVAYATFKDEKGKEEQRLRIGQGYPLATKDSWSSPDYVIRSVSNFGVPYKFTVPGLEKYK